MTQLFTIDENNYTVVLNSRDAIAQVMEDTGVSSLVGFNRAAILIVRQFGQVQGVTLDDNDLEHWTLGAVTMEDATYLQGFLAGDASEIVSLSN